jgi:phosphate starvation-inducible PhoH-like protein
MKVLPIIFSVSCLMTASAFKRFSTFKKISSVYMTKKHQKNKQKMLFYQNPENSGYKPKTFNQETYVNYLNNYETKIIIVSGPAGSGKTLFACQKAITALKSKEINKIVITRPIVTVDEDIGFLPGNIKKKMEPWTKPIFDIFLETYSKTELDNLLNQEIIEICPLAFMRGRTFKDAFIIADEMQNSSPNQMIMLATRIGENSRMVITGDLKQTDIMKENGLNDFVNIILKYEKNVEATNLIKQVTLTGQDIERSEVVRKVIEIYDYKENKYSHTVIPVTPVTPVIPVIPIASVDKDVSSIEMEKAVFGEVVNNDVNTKSDASIIPASHVTQNYSGFLNFMMRK